MTTKGRVARATSRAGLIAALAVALASCGGGEDSASEEGGNTVTLGLLAPITGIVAADGVPMRDGAQLAVDELNQAGGVNGYKFKLKVVDTPDQKPDAVASGAQELIGDPDVKAVLTGYASTTNFEIDTFAQAKIPYLIAGNSAQTRGIISKDPSKYPMTWSLTPSFDGYGEGVPALIDQWGKEGKYELRNKKAFIITSDNPYSQDISTRAVKTFKSLGWTIAGNEKVPFSKINDWGTVLSKIRSADPQAIFITDYQAGNEAAFMKQFQERPTKSLIYIQYGPSVPEFLELTKDDSTGVIYSLLGTPVLSPTWKPAVDAIAKYKDKYGKDPGSYGTVLYDEVMLYADALKQVGSPDEKAKIGEVIGKMRKDISTGSLVFDPKTHLAVQGDDASPLQVLEIVDGKRILLAPEKVKTGEFSLPPWMK